MVPSPARKCGFHHIPVSSGSYSSVSISGGITNPRSSHFGSLLPGENPTESCCLGLQNMPSDGFLSFFRATHSSAFGRETPQSTCLTQTTARRTAEAGRAGVLAAGRTSVKARAASGAPRGGATESFPSQGRQVSPRPPCASCFPSPLIALRERGSQFLHRPSRLQAAARSCYSGFSITVSKPIFMGSFPGIELGLLHLQGKNPPTNTGDPGSVPGWGRFPGEGNVHPPSTLAWRIPWAEEPGGLPSMAVAKSQTRLSN